QRCEAILAAGRRTAPGFFGYVLSPASPVGVAADLVASAANQNLTAWRSAPAAAQLEWLVVKWLGQLAGFSEDAAGILVSGGTTATGAVDRLDAIATLAREQDLWFHVDGAYGALAASQPSQRHLFDGIEQADSLSIDPHKWLYVPIDCGALLLRQPSPGAFGS